MRNHLQEYHCLVLSAGPQASEGPTGQVLSFPCCASFLRAIGTLGSGGVCVESDQCLGGEVGGR
jgi:hypothetical protein